MRYFCTHPPPPLLLLFFSLSFLTLSLSLKPEQAEVLNNISTLFSWDFQYDPCQWQGVTCTENGGDDVVGLDLSAFYMNNGIWQYVCQLPALQLLDLSHRYIVGPIPDCVGSFPNLTILRLSDCGISGSIPSRLASLRNLQVLDLSDNQLTGFIPPQLLTLSSLEDLDLSFNKLSGEMPQDFSSSLLRLSMKYNNLRGTIPSAISNARNLTHLEMSDNSLKGPIPGQLGSCTQLKSLRLDGNKLFGPLNHVLPKLLQLTDLSLSNNMFEGNILDELSNLSNLNYLDLSVNLLSGNISSKIFNLKKLTTLYLHENYLTGIIPLNIQNGKLLQKLRFDRNNLTGTIPLGIGNLRFMVSLKFFNNMLTGEIPEALGNMSQLYELDLSNNKLTGEIPEALGNMGWLYELDLSNNKLTGEIPEALRNMGRLNKLDLSNNKLTGEIPGNLGNMTQLNKLDLSNNKLTGEITEILETLENTDQLDKLDLSNNKLIGEIPELLYWNIMYLDWLDLSNNKLSGIVPEWVKLIRHVNLSNNELVDSSKIELVDSVPMGRSHSTLKILGVVGALVIFLGVVGALVIFIICCLVVGVVWIRNLHSRAEFKETFRKILEKVEHPRISHEELLAATNRFHNSNLLSTNSFGSVYKGFLPDATRVAVKVLNLMHDQSEKIFRAECRVLQKARHRNLARIITTCSTPHFKALVFQYFTNGSLDKHLYLDRCTLGLRKLLNIAIDVAHAVEYLHYDCFVQIVHCDIKPSNVLLDETMTAHLSDYGISRLIGRIAANSVTSTINLKGSVGYIAPEYGLNGMISPRGDVYSYGILLLEMLTRRRPTDNMFDGDLNLHNWVKRAFADRAFEVIDESLLMERAGKETEECLISLMRLGLLCSTDSAEARPNMREVSNLLKLIQQDFTTDTSSSIKLMPTISNLVCDKGAITNCEQASDTRSSSF